MTIDKDELDGSKAAEARFNDLHNLVTEELIQRIQSKLASHQELMAAIQWLKANGIDSPAKSGSPTSRLADLIPLFDPEDVQRQVNGT
jgi:phosphoserine phosphatase